MAVNYRDLGFVNTREMFKKAFAGGYAVPAYNFNNMEQLQAIINGCGISNSPLILQVSSGARKYADQTMLRYMAEGAVAMARKAGYKTPSAYNRSVNSFKKGARTTTRSSTRRSGFFGSSRSTTCTRSRSSGFFGG